MIKGISSSHHQLLVPFSTTSTMDLALDWVPSLDPLTELQELVECDSKPMPLDKPWLRSSLANELAKVPGHEELLWNSVVMIWRLKYLEGNLERPRPGFAEAWEDHVSAWLVSRLVGMTSGRGWLIGDLIVSSQGHLLVFKDRTVPGCHGFRGRHASG